MERTHAIVAGNMNAFLNFLNRTLTRIGNQLGLEVMSTGNLYCFVVKQKMTHFTQLKIKFFDSLGGRLLARFLMRKPSLLALDDEAIAAKKLT